MGLHAPRTRILVGVRRPSKAQFDQAPRRLIDGELWMDLVLNDRGVDPDAPVAIRGRVNRSSTIKITEFPNACEVIRA